MKGVKIVTGGRRTNEKDEKMIEKKEKELFPFVVNGSVGGRRIKKEEEGWKERKLKCN